MTFHADQIRRFRYLGLDLGLDRGPDATAGVISCRYGLDDEWTFVERVRLPGLDAWTDAARAAARWVFLLAGVSYYKAAAPPVIDLGPVTLTPAEAAFLRSFYLHGLGEYAYRNGLDLSDLSLDGDIAAPAQPVAYRPTPGRPLIPFGGGIDSIVTVEQVRAAHPDAALFVVNRAGDRFAAIEAAAAVTGLPVVRAEREIDPLILRSAQLGFRNGHVPVTGILSAIAVTAAVAGGRDAVVMSNEWSASIGNVSVDGRSVNHQYSKSLSFEAAFRAVLADSFDRPPQYFSFLRPLSELRIAELFAQLPAYHRTFRSCNRAFHLDPAARAERWCGRCDKCCFIDLILAPFLPTTELATVFDGREPLDQPDLAEQFRTLVGLSANLKPFECVGDVGECRAAVVAAAARPDRQACRPLQELADALAPERPAIMADAARLARPLGPHHVPADYATAALLG